MNSLAALLNRPLALHPAEAEKIAAILRGDLESSALLFEREEGVGSLSLVDGIAIIRVRGVLSNSDWGWWGAGYGEIRLGIAAAIADPGVRGIALDVNSPGGDVAGLFDLVDTIYAARDEKPIYAVLSESAYSAAYAIASAATRIFVPRTGGTGSIGIVTMHTDYSQALKDSGVKVTIFHYGARKADGNPFEPISDGAAKAIQADVDAMGELFVSTVARNRGLPADVIRGTEAATFLGKQGVDLGLADEIAAPDAAFRALLEKLG